MLVSKSQGFDLQEIILAKQSVDINAQSVCRLFGVESGAQTPKGMGMIDFNTLSMTLVATARKLRQSPFTPVADRHSGHRSGVANANHLWRHLSPTVVTRHPCR